MLLSNATFTDRLYLGYFFGLTVAIVVLSHRVPRWEAYVALHAMLMALILALVSLSRRLPHAHAWYPLLLPIIAFPEAAQLRDLFVDEWRDAHLLAIEAVVFPEPPTVWLSRFSSTLFSEILQGGYLSYFLFLPIVAGVLYMRDDKAPFHGVMAAVVLGYLACYAIFLVFPTEGPAYTLRHLHTAPLPNGPLRSLVAFVQKAGTHGNAFPSAHAVGAVVPLIYARRYVPKAVPWLAPLLLLMCVGAVYDRYHYASDMIGGVIIGMAAAAFVMAAQSRPRWAHVLNLPLAQRQQACA
ncbi:MAG TPA: phosphatase PAP2 family protein [Vicinamibacterales bacterium]